MKTAVTIARLLLGFIFLVFGLDFFLHFLEKLVTFPAIGPKASDYLGALANAGYFFPVLKSIEVVCGIFLLVNRYTALFIVVVFPIALNIFLFDVFLATSLLFLGGGILVLNLFLAYAYRKNYGGLVANQII